MTRTLGGVRGALRQFLAEPSTRLYEAIVFHIPIFTFHFGFRFLLSAYFTSAVVLSILAVAYSILAVASFTLAVVLSILV